MPGSSASLSKGTRRVTMHRVSRIVQHLSTEAKSLPGSSLSGLSCMPVAGNMGFENPVKKKLREGGIVIAGTVTSPNVENALVRNSLLYAATRGMRAVPFTRVPVVELWTAKRMLDIGSLGVIFPFTSTPELARTATAAVRYPKRGLRGCGPGLAELRWNSGDRGYHKWADEQVMCIIIIEQQRAIDAIDEIAAVPGIDLLFIGVADLAFSMAGEEAALSTPPVQAALRKVIAAGKKYGIPCGIPCGNAEQMKKYIEMGFRFFQGPSDVNFMQKAMTSWTSSLDSAGIVSASGQSLAGPKSLY